MAETVMAFILRRIVPSENAFLFSFGLKPASNFAFGVTAKILYYSLFEGIKSTTASVDVGAIYLLS